MKKKIIKVEIGDMEYGPEIINLEGKSFDNLQSADTFILSQHLLARQSLDKKGFSGSYYKMDFTITFEDGNTYKGTFDLGGKSESLLSRHVICFVGIYAEKLFPIHFTLPMQENFIKNNQFKEQYLTMWNNYDFGQPNL